MSTLNAHGGIGYLAIHALQFGAQPILAKRYIVANIPTASLVLSAEFVKIVGCIIVLHIQGRLRAVLHGWTFRRSLLAAGIPSLTYLVQNYCIQIAYQNLDGVIVNICNQSKMLSTALFSFLIAGRRQSPMQCVALVLVMFAGVLTSISERSTTKKNKHGNPLRVRGIICILLASILSGLGSGITEWNLQHCERDSFLYSIEMATLGCFMIMCSLPLGITIDAKVWHNEGLFAHWNAMTIVPVLSQGWGGIIVGLITKTAGGVKKSFAVICGLLLTCILQCFITQERLPPLIRLAIPIVAVSIVVHAYNPPQNPGNC